MRNNTFPKNLLPAGSTLLLTGFIILFPFFKSKAQKTKKETPAGQTTNDSNRNKSITINSGDLDKAISEMDRINLDSIGSTVQTAMASVNFDAIGKSIETAMRSINTDSLRIQVQEAMKQVDMQKIQVDLDKAMIELKNSNWQKEMEAGMKEIKKIDFPAIQKEMEGAQKEIAAAGVTVKVELAKAKEEIQKARLEMTQLKDLLTDMKKDGLIKDGENIKLEWKNNRLFINGKEQSAAVSEKYKALEDLHIMQNHNDSDDENEL